MKPLEIVNLDIREIVADENQPRKLFNPERLSDLRSSVKRLGVKVPITVEHIGEKYLIVDGERRFRVANELKLKELPAVVMAPQKKADRLVEQFHLQEQHESWSPTEKAMAVSDLADELGLTLTQLSDMLAIPSTTTRRYMDFAGLADKSHFYKNKINIEWAVAIQSLKRDITRIYGSQNEDFGRVDQKRFERAMVARIVSGDIQKKNDVSKLRDAFRKEPESIKEFINTDITPNALFVKTKARGASLLRNLTFTSRYMANYVRDFLIAGDIKLSKEEIAQLETTHKELGELLNRVR